MSTDHSRRLANSAYKTMPNNLARVSRRQLLAGLGTSAALMPLLATPSWALGGGDLQTLILIELEGGNDGLNTVVPFRDPHYRQARPTLALGADALVQLDSDTGLHSALKPLAQHWQNGEMRVIEGVGYVNPNLSHFRSIEIWNHGLGAASNATQGWVSQALANAATTMGADADGLVLGGAIGPLNGQGRFTVVSELEGLEWQSEILNANLAANGNDNASANAMMMASDGGGSHAVRASNLNGQKNALDHLLTVQSNAAQTLDTLQRKLNRSRQREWNLPDTELGWQLNNVLALLDAGVRVPVMKVSLGGFDTHASQAEQHADLLEQLGQAVAGFSKAAKQIGIWDQVTLMTYSEFGRTFIENGSAGTDHGTAAPVIITGGRVDGGLGGVKTSLEASDLVDNEPTHTTDLRAVYDGVLTDLWGLRGMGGYGAQKVLRG